MENPDFYDWTKVHVNYCDGSSWSGDRREPLKTKSGQRLFMRGRHNLDATLASLLDNGLASATHVIMKGQSAGALAIFLHVDYIRSRLHSDIDFVALADSGMFLNLPTWTGWPGYAIQMQGVVELHKVTGLNDRCVQQYSHAERWHCFMAPYILPHITTPLFIVQALYDAWQTEYIVNLNCVDHACQDHKQYQSWLNLSAQQQIALKQAPQGSGVFAKPCYIHGMVNKDDVWKNWKVNGTSMRDSFSYWWRTRNGLNLVDNRPYGSDCPRIANWPRLWIFLVGFTSLFCVVVSACACKVYRRRYVCRDVAAFEKLISADHAETSL